MRKYIIGSDKKCGLVGLKLDISSYFIRAERFLCVSISRYCVYRSGRIRTLLLDHCQKIDIIIKGKGNILSVIINA